MSSRRDQESPRGPGHPSGVMQALRSRATEPRARPDDHPDGERHPAGWRITPGPDGRGAPPPRPPASTWRSGRFLLFLVLLLMINIWVVSLIPSGTRASPDSLQPDVPDTGTGRQRRVGVVEGLDGPGRVPPRGALPGAQDRGEGHEALRHRGADLREFRPALRTARAEGRRGEREASERGSLAARDCCSSACCPRC